jgi:hypothetical protein
LVELIFINADVKHFRVSLPSINLSDSFLNTISAFFILSKIHFDGYKSDFFIAFKILRFLIESSSSTIFVITEDKQSLQLLKLFLIFNKIDPSR